jgi:hypothetical protein
MTKKKERSKEGWNEGRKEGRKKERTNERMEEVTGNGRGYPRRIYTALIKPRAFGVQFVNYCTYHTHPTHFFSVVKQPNSGLGRLYVEVSISHTIKHTHTR